MPSQTLLSALRSAHAARAELFYRVYQELLLLLGQEEALAVLGRACRQTGLAKQQRYESYGAHESPEAFCEALIGHSEVAAALFDMAPGATAASVKLQRCVLVDGWRKLGVPDEEIALLCRAAREVDYGTLEGLGLQGEFSELLSEGGACCHLHVERGGCQGNAFTNQ